MLAHTETRYSRPQAGKSRPEGEDVSLEDGAARLLGIPFFGLVIPRVTDSLAGLSVEDPAYWVGSAWFLLLSAAVWHANRWSHLEQRRRWRWVHAPVRKVAALLLSIVAITSALTVSSMLSWYTWLEVAPPWPVITSVVTIVVACVACVIHLYETMFLVREQADARTRVASLERAHAAAVLEALHAQADPRFLFHSLDTLGRLIATSPAKAAAFNEHLAEVQRYMLRHSRATLVSLAEELRFLADYVALMKIRFGAALTVTINLEPEVIAIAASGSGANRGPRLPPTALQLAVQSAIERSELEQGTALTIALHLNDESIEVRGGIPRGHRDSEGLRLLDERSQLATGRALQREERAGQLVLRIPISPGRTP